MAEKKKKPKKNPTRDLSVFGAIKNLFEMKFRNATADDATTPKRKE